MQISFPPILLAAFLAFGCERGNAATPVPAPQPDPTWTGAAPIVDGYSDPNRIVYDDGYLRSYEAHKAQAAIRCGGHSESLVTTPDGEITVKGSMSNSELGHKFRIDDLLRFLQTRIKNPVIEQVFPIRDTALLKRIRTHEYSWDPWTEDLNIAMELAAGSGYEPAVAILSELARRDPNSNMRIHAAFGLARMSRKYPKAFDVLVEIFNDPVRCKDAFEPLRTTRDSALPIFVKALDSDVGGSRNAAAHELARKGIYEKDCANLVRCLQHRRADVRDIAVSVVRQEWGITKQLSLSPEVAAALAAMLAEPERPGLNRLDIMRLLRFSKVPPTNARAALKPIAEGEETSPDDLLRRFARETIAAIDAAEKN